MKIKKFWLFMLICMLSLFANTIESQTMPTTPHNETSVLKIRGEPVITLVRPGISDASEPQFMSATFLPGQGMNLLQIRAYLPDRGEVDLLNSPALKATKKLLEQDNDVFGNQAFAIGSAILLPYANRMCGKFDPETNTITTRVAGKTVSLPANWQGKKTAAHKCAIHGLMLNAAFEDIQQQDQIDQSSVSGYWYGKDFSVNWPSATDVNVKAILKNTSLEITVTAKNVGDESLPMGIGMHPYFIFPSGNRQQARLYIPSKTRALINNYEDVFPTGKLASVTGTPFDFSAKAGTPLGNIYLDDSFTKLQRDAQGAAVVTLIDPAANYGLRIKALSPEIKTFQIYAPPNQNFIAIEPQFNLTDPYNKKVWGKTDTGMVMLVPGESVSWRMRLELFTPESNKAIDS